MVDGNRKIEIVKRQVMPHLEGVTEARYYVEKMNKEVQKNLQADAAEKLNPMGVQDDDDCEDEGEEDHDDYLFCDPAQIKKDEPEKSAPAFFKRVELPSSDELRKKTETLDRFQKEVVNMVVTNAKDLVKARKHSHYPNLFSSWFMEALEQGNLR